MLQVRPGTGTSLVIQWLRIHLPVKGTWVGFLVWEDFTCCRATKPHAATTKALEHVLHKRSHGNKKPEHRNQRRVPTCHKQRKPSSINKDPAPPLPDQNNK